MLRRTIVAVFLLAGCLHAQSVLSIHDSSLVRATHDIPVYATLSVQNGDSVCMAIRFDPLLVDISDVRGAQLGINAVQYSVETISTRQALLHVGMRCPALNLNLGKLILLKAELLAGPDTISTLSPTSLCINANSISSVTLKSGTLRYLNDQPIGENDVEFLSVPYPNPGSDQKFLYRILVKCSVHFTVFDVSGRMMDDVVLPEQDKGTYDIILSNSATPYLCDATYFLRMITPAGVYVVPFGVLH